MSSLRLRLSPRRAPLDVEDEVDLDVASRPESALIVRLRASFEFLRRLFDLEFRELLIPRMLPTLYLLGIAASGYAVVAFALDGFAQSAVVGLLRLLLIGPVAFLVMVTLLRFALELCIAIFRIALHVNELAGHAEDIADGIPRISFWKPRKKR
ncbi:MAG TPA: DUF4282 domain-containing protein [Solimonas sp.]